MQFQGRANILQTNSAAFHTSPQTLPGAVKQGAHQGQSAWGQILAFPLVNLMTQASYIIALYLSFLMSENEIK